MEEQATCGEIQLGAGTIAYCQHNSLGVITHQDPNGVWRGWHFGHLKPMGSKWSSRKPRIVGFMLLEEARKLLKET